MRKLFRDDAVKAVPSSKTNAQFVCDHLQIDFGKPFVFAIHKVNSMKKVKLVLMAVVFGLLYSCSKSDHLEPMRLDGPPHKKDTLINNSIPDIIFNNQGSS